MPSGLDIKAIAVPWMVGDECWTLVPVVTWSDPIPCAECGGKGEHKTAKGNIRQCPDCSGRKETFTSRTTYYTRWSKVSWIELRHGLHLTEPHLLYSVVERYGKESGGGWGGKGRSVPVAEIFATEADAIKYAEAKGYEWHPAIQGKRPEDHP